MKALTFIGQGLLIMILALGLLYLGYSFGIDIGRYQKGTWTKEIRTRTDTIYHFKPE